jgi:nitroreductase
MTSGEAGAATLDRDAVADALEIAVRAPSIHNTQPWAWRLGPDGLVLRADRTRQLAVADPDGHSLLVSCGAAAHLTELALRAQGWRIETTLFPDLGDPDALALFRAVGRQDPDTAATGEVQAASARRSDRRPFSSEPLAPQLVDELQVAASDSAARVHVPTQPDQRIDLAVAVSWADRIERDDDAYKAEMNRWLHDPDVHAMADGVPLDAVPHVPDDAPRHTNVPLRDFEVGVTGKLLIERDVDEKPLIAVVITDFDTPRDHLHAGRAMMQVMLAAHRRGLSTCPLSQAVDFAAFRTRVQRAMGWVGYPQIMLRVGYPGGPLDELVRTPRRPVEDVLRIA